MSLRKLPAGGEVGQDKLEKEPLENEEWGFNGSHAKFTFQEGDGVSWQMQLRGGCKHQSPPARDGY